MGPLEVIDPVLALALGVCILFFVIGQLNARRTRPGLLPLKGLDGISEKLDAAIESGSPLTSVIGGPWSYGISESSTALSVHSYLEAYVSRLSLPVSFISSAAFAILPTMSDSLHNQTVWSKPAPVVFTGPEPFFLASSQPIQTEPGMRHYLAVYGALPPDCSLLVTAAEHAQLLVCATSMPLSALLTSQNLEALVFGEHFYTCPEHLQPDNNASLLRVHDWIRWSILLAILAGIAVTLLISRRGGL